MSADSNAAFALQMPRLEWKSEYETGIAIFDNQHKVLFEYVNDLRDIMMGKKTDVAIMDKTLLAILDYTVTHFLGEEVFLYKAGYPEFENHTKSHDEFIRQVKDLYVRFKAGDSGNRIISAEITAILTEWIQDHILKDDFDYAKFVKEKGLHP